MTETEKMLAGKIYDASDSHLADRRIVAHRLSKQFNNDQKTNVKVIRRLRIKREKNTANDMVFAAWAEQR